MASKMINCAGCVRAIEGGEYLKCNICAQVFDLDCANVSSARFRNTMTIQHKSKWTCQECKSKKPKVGNVNTPVRDLKNDCNLAFSDNSCEDLTNITFRKKSCSSSRPDPTTAMAAKIPISDRDDSSTIKDQIVEAIKGLLPSMFTKILQSELAPIKGDLRDLRESVSFLSDKYEELKVKVEMLSKSNDDLISDNSKLKYTVLDVTNRLNSIEQNLRANNLELNGVTEHRNENLINLMQQCSSVIGYKMSNGDILSCTRVAKKEKEIKRPRTIVAKFKSVLCRDEFLSAVQRYNKSNADKKLSTSLLGIGGENQPIYVQEHLSPNNRILHAAARKKAKEHKYQFVWVRNGRIYARKNPDSAFIHVL